VGCYERSVLKVFLASYIDVSFLISRSGEVDGLRSSLRSC